MNTFVRVVLVAIVCFAVPIAAQKPDVCDTPKHREFDFWLGTWDVFERGTTTKIADAVVTSELDGCVIREVYKDRGGLRGESLSSYDARSNQWQQTWLTNRGQLLVINGEREGTSLTFTGWIRQGTTETLVRATWTPEPEGVHETADRSTDHGKSWSRWFDLSFRRSADRRPR
jgi:hypothetical protein